MFYMQSVYYDVASNEFNENLHIDEKLNVKNELVKALVFILFIIDIQIVIHL